MIHNFYVSHCIQIHKINQHTFFQRKRIPFKEHIYIHFYLPLAPGHFLLTPESEDARA